MFYQTIKYLHVTCVTLSLCGFCLRGWWLWRRKSVLTAWHGGRRWLHALPHVNDSLLLVAGITLAVQLGQYPLVDDWLTAKLGGLLAYIALGALALAPRRPWRMRLAAGLAAVAVYGWIVAVALTKNPLGGLAG